PQGLLSASFGRAGVVPAARGRVLDADDLSAIFGVDIEFEAPPTPPAPLTERLVDRLAEAGAADAPTLAAALGEDPAGVRTELEELRALGIVARRGRGARATWEIG